MAYSIINYTSQGTASSGAAVTTTAMSTTGADLLIAIISNAQAAGQAVFTDSASNAWTATTRRVQSGSGAIQVFYVQAPSTSASHTLTIGALAGNLASVCFIAVAGSVASPFDTEAGASAATTGSITTAAANELVVAGYQDATASAIGANSPGLILASIAVIGGNRFAMAAMLTIRATASAGSLTFTPNGAVTAPSSTIVAFKTSTSGGGASGGAWAFA